VKTALVTGHLGFIGTHVAAAVADAGYKVTGLDIADGPAHDARNYFRSHASCIRYDLVVHCAAVVGGRKVMDWTPLDHAANLEIDAALFQWAARTKPGRVIYFSSSCAYPSAWWGKPFLHEPDIDLYHPQWPDKLYGWTKLTGELLAETVRGEGIPVSVVRPFSVYGPGMKEGFAVRGFLEQIQRRADPVEVWGDAGQVRDYVHVSDVANAVVAMVEQGIDGPVNLGTGRGTSLAELVALMGKAAGYEPQVKVNTALPAGVQSLVADATLLRSFCPPQVVLEDYLAQAVKA
jgi:nucleoside-diphosphate-sugar epimerase